MIRRLALSLVLVFAGFVAGVIVTGLSRAEPKDRMLTAADSRAEAAPAARSA